MHSLTWQSTAPLSWLQEEEGASRPPSDWSWLRPSPTGRWSIDYNLITIHVMIIMREVLKNKSRQIWKFIVLAEFRKVCYVMLMSLPYLQQLQEYLRDISKPWKLEDPFRVHQDWTHCTQIRGDLLRYLRTVKQLIHSWVYVKTMHGNWDQNVAIYWILNCIRTTLFWIKF